MHPTWKEAFRLYRQVLWDPPTDADKKRLAKLSKRTFRSAESEAVRKKLNEELFSYGAFLRNLGRMSLSALTSCVHRSICLFPFRSRGPRGSLYPTFPPKPFMRTKRFGPSPPSEYEPLQGVSRRETRYRSRPVSSRQGPGNSRLTYFDQEKSFSSATWIPLYRFQPGNTSFGSGVSRVNVRDARRKG